MDSERKIQPEEDTPRFVQHEFLRELPGGEGLGVPFGWFPLNSIEPKESP